MEKKEITPLAPKPGDVVFWRTSGIRSEVVGGTVIDGHGELVTIEITYRMFRDYAGFHKTRTMMAMVSDLHPTFTAAYNGPITEGKRCSAPWWLVRPDGVPCTPGV